MSFSESSGYRLYFRSSCSFLSRIPVFYEDKRIFHHEKDAACHEGNLWMRRLPRYHSLLLHKKSLSFNLNFEFHQCHLRQLLLNLELNILDSIYYNRAPLLTVLYRDLWFYPGVLSTQTNRSCIKGFNRYDVVLVQWNSLLVCLEYLFRNLVSQLHAQWLLLNTRQRVILELKGLETLVEGPDVFFNMTYN